MKIRVGANSLSIFLGVGSTDDEKKKSPGAAPDQNNPRGFYVYGHYDSHGSLFYVGKGIDRRAWAMDRHYLWQRYVKHNLGGNFEVRIIADGMSAAAAEELEARLIAEQGNSLVNWANMGRSSDFKLLTRYHALRDANRALIQNTRVLEKIDPESAVRNYKTAIEKTVEYAFMDFEPGLVGQMLSEECSELGRRGEPLAIERLTMCLLKLGRVAEAAEVSEAYFLRYKRDLETDIGNRTKARIEKALARSG
jgi:hypothetical protein